tara:strand:+ start:313 stop:534 length:222 start_codon:yes stop_codon:yes gene_type:complete
VGWVGPPDSGISIAPRAIEGLSAMNTAIPACFIVLVFIGVQSASIGDLSSVLRAAIVSIPRASWFRRSATPDL